jgi:1-acyl-sn-glycerol-3-phosphate acyltransferase
MSSSPPGPGLGRAAAIGSLSAIERWALWLGRTTNETRRGKRVQELFLRSVAYAWIRASLARRMFVEGLDELASVKPPQGVLLVANHRSFFDLYAIMLGMWMGPVPWARQLFFPVRSNFFYDEPLGVLVNFIVGAGVMYPPIFRARGQTERNHHAIRLMSDFLQEPNSLLGIHPEGTRNTGDDPYQLLPAQPGVGEIALLAKPTIIPVFINGLSNNIISDVRANYADGIRRTKPVICIFGKPLDCSPLFLQKPRPALYKQASDRFNQEILALGAREAKWRELCGSGEIRDDHPGWLSNRGRGFFYARPH